MNAGAKAGIEFLHALPEPVQFLVYVAMVIALGCILGSLLGRGVP